MWSLCLTKWINMRNCTPKYTKGRGSKFKKNQKILEIVLCRTHEQIGAKHWQDERERHNITHDMVLFIHRLWTVCRGTENESKIHSSSDLFPSFWLSLSLSLSLSLCAKVLPICSLYYMSFSGTPKGTNFEIFQNTLVFVILNLELGKSHFGPQHFVLLI